MKIISTYRIGIIQGVKTPFVPIFELCRIKEILSTAGGGFEPRELLYLNEKINLILAELVQVLTTCGLKKICFLETTFYYIKLLKFGQEVPK